MAQRMDLDFGRQGPVVQASDITDLVGDTLG
jgi:hypothetical protein